MSLARQRLAEEEQASLRYSATDNSFDSYSDECSKNYAAYFSRKKVKPKLSFDALTQHQLELIIQFPKSAFEINALAYYYGLFTPKNHCGLDVSFNRLFCFFAPDELELTHDEIKNFRDDLKRYSQ